MKLERGLSFSDAIAEIHILATLRIFRRPRVATFTPCGEITNVAMAHGVDASFRNRLRNSIGLLMTGALSRPARVKRNLGGRLAVEVLWFLLAQRVLERVGDALECDFSRS